MGSITKGNIGAQDFHGADGTLTRTFNRTTSTGAALTLTDATYEVDALVAYGGGSRFTKATIDAALAVIGTTNLVTILLRPGTWTFSVAADYSAYTNVTFKMVPGTILELVDGDLTFGGPVDCGIHTLISYTGTGRVHFDANDVIYAAWFGFNLTASSTVNANAIQYAITSFSTYGGTVKLHRGYFNVDADVIDFSNCKNVTLCGAGNAFGYELAKAGTFLMFGTGTVGLDLSDYSVSHYNMIRDLAINGNSKLDYGIKIASVNGIEHSFVQGCEEAGIWISALSNMLKLYKVAACYNTNGIGILAKGNSTTIFSLQHIVCRQNTIGLKIENGVNVTITDAVLESNTAEGLYLYKNTGDWISDLWFKNCWLENNYDGASGYQAVIDSQTHDYSDGPISYITFESCNFNAAGTQKHLSIQSARWVNLVNCNLLGGDRSNGLSLGSHASYVYFYDGQPATEPTGSVGNRGGYINKGTGSNEDGILNSMGFTGPMIKVAYFDEAATAGGLYSYVNKVTKSITADTTVTMSSLFPANATILAVYIQVTSALAAGETWNATLSGGKTMEVAHEEAVAKNTKIYTPFNGLNTAGSLSAVAHGDLQSPVCSGTATNLDITRHAGGAFTAQGEITAYGYYMNHDTLPNV